MKNRLDAVKALSAAGWTPTEIKSVLGSVSKPLTAPQSHTTSPWWTCMSDDQYSDGNPLVEDWYNWLEQRKPM